MRRGASPDRALSRSVGPRRGSAVPRGAEGVLRRERARRPAPPPLLPGNARAAARDPACGSAVPPPGAAPPAPPGLRWRPASSRAGCWRPGWRGRRAARRSPIPGAGTGSCVSSPRGWGGNRSSLARRDPRGLPPETSPDRHPARRSTWTGPKGTFYQPTPPDSGSEEGG